MELIVRQTVTSGSSRSTFELLIDGSRRAIRTLNTDMEVDRLLLKEAQRAVHEAQRQAIADRDRRAIMLTGPVNFLDGRDRHAETQAMVRAFAGVVFPETRLAP